MTATAHPTIRVIADGLGRCEGPVIRQSGSVAVASITAGGVYEIMDGRTQLLAQTEGGPNGLTEGANGDLYVAQLGSRQHAKREPRIWGGVQRITPDGTVAWISQDPYSPNDICVGPDGMLYVSDPVRRPWTGRYQDGRLWRCDPVTLDAELLDCVEYYPNGVGFGLEDDAFYVASTSHAEILRYPLSEAGLGTPEVFARLAYGTPDGFAFDVDGNLVVGAIRLDGELGELQAYDRDGRFLDSLRPGDSSLYTNLAIGADGTAIVTSTGAGHVLEIAGWARPGLPLHPFR